MAEKDNVTDLPVIIYQGQVYLEGDNYVVKVQDFPLPEGSTYGATVTEAINNAEIRLTQYVRQEIARTGVPPEAKPNKNEGDACKDDFVKVVTFRISIPDLNYRERNIYLADSLINALEVAAKGLDTDYSGYINEAVRKDLGLSGQGQSYFYRSLISLTNAVKTSIHRVTLNRYDKTVNLTCDDNYKLKKDLHYKTTVDVYHRLLLRYAVLRDVEKLEMRYGVHSSITDNDERKPSPETNLSGGIDQIYSKLNTPKERNENEINPALRAYKLATTDVFVEKAISYLEQDSKKYQLIGLTAYILAGLSLIAGVFISGAQFNPFQTHQYPPSAAASMPTDNSVKEFRTVSLQGNIPKAATLEMKMPSEKDSKIASSPSSLKLDNWKDVIVRFTQGFTFYGMLVLTVVGLWRIGRAMLDQSERLKDRRHALRQGRLYVHLNDGVLRPDELEKVFAWNKEGDNAFSKIPTEASAPWGGVFKEAFKAFADAFNKGKKGVND